MECIVETKASACGMLSPLYHGNNGLRTLRKWRKWLREPPELSGPARADHYYAPGSVAPTRGRIHLRRLRLIHFHDYSESPTTQGGCIHLRSETINKKQDLGTCYGEKLATECSYRCSFVVHYLEDGIQLRNLQQVLYLLGQVQELQFATLLANRSIGAD